MAPPPSAQRADWPECFTEWLHAGEPTTFATIVALIVGIALTAWYELSVL